MSPPHSLWAIAFASCQVMLTVLRSFRMEPHNMLNMFLFINPLPTLGARGLSCAVSGLGQCLYCDPFGRQVTKGAARNFWYPGYPLPDFVPQILVFSILDIITRIKAALALPLQYFSICSLRSWRKIISHVRQWQRSRQFSRRSRKIPKWLLPILLATSPPVYSRSAAKILLRTYAREQTRQLRRINYLLRIVTDNYSRFFLFWHSFVNPSFSYTDKN